MKIINKISELFRKIKYKDALSSKSIEDRFSKIYESGIWFKNKESKSGAGSTLKSTQKIREEFPVLLRSLDAKNLTDIGCGDFNWMKEVDLPCDYIGIDIVKSVVEENIDKYLTSNRKFLHADMVTNSFPKESDVILCREVLFHLSFNDGKNLINNIINSNARYLIITTDDSINYNKDIKTGAYRGLNLNLFPFSFPKPYKVIDDTGVSKTRRLGVFNVNSLRVRG